MSLLSSARLCAVSVLSGVQEAVSLKRCFVAVRGSRTIRTCVLKCLLLNGCLFLGSIVIFEHMLKPLLTMYASASIAELADDSETLDVETSAFNYRRMLASALSLSYYVFWIFPWYVLSYIFNASWYGKIAKRYIELRQAPMSKSTVSARTPPATSAIDQFYASLKLIQSRFADTVYTNLLFLGMGIQCSLASAIPYIGKPLQFVLLCWLYAFYCFDYKWSIAGYSVEQRKAAFVGDWAFFLGFGAPLTLLSSYLPFFVSYGIFALIFPLFILLAIAAKPAGVAAGQLGRPPLFTFPSAIAQLIVIILMRGRTSSSNDAKSE